MHSHAPEGREQGNDLPRGLKLGPYRILRILGQGGFGVTYLAQDSQTGENVVIKESLPNQFASRNSTTRCISARIGEESSYEWATKRFLEEAALLSSLNHPNIVRVIKAFTALGTAYYVMPWVGGTSLDNKPLTDKPENCDIAAQHLLTSMLDTLTYLHGNNLQHRDIKPANILMTQDGNPVLIDFGTARASISRKTQTRIESPGYTPIEQLQEHGKVGPWSDIYALAATMIKVLTGEDPPVAADRLGSSPPFIPLASRPELRRIYAKTFLKSIDKGFAFQSKKRWQSAAEWKEYLQTGGSTNRAILWCGLGAAAVLTFAAGLCCGGFFNKQPAAPPLTPTEAEAAPTAEPPPNGTQTDGTQTDGTQTDGTQPGETQPGETQPGETQPGETQPGETQTDETQTSGTQPSGTQPSGTLTGETEPAGPPLGRTQTDGTQPSGTLTGETEPAGPPLGRTQTDETQTDETQTNGRFPNETPLTKASKHP